MSLTYPSQTLRSDRGTFLQGHDQLKPFLLAVAMFAVSVAVALAFTGLPS